MATVLKYAHELVMFFAVAVSIGGSTMVFRLAKTTDVVGIRSVFQYFRPTAKLIAPLYALGTLLGLATVWIMEFDWLASWLVISYALTIVAAILGRFTEDWARRVDGLAIEEKGATPGPELQAVLNERAPRIIRMIDMVLILVFVGLMVFRPRFW
jgi:hypothetical protein